MPEVTAEVTVETTIEVEVYCQRCGAGLCGQTESVTTYARGRPAFRVEPCQSCLDDAESKGYSEGYEAAEKECDK